MAKRDEVLAALRLEDVLDHLGIGGRWSGRWLRSRRCARTDHNGDAFGVSRDGMWHCWSCDEGGDLLKLIAIGAGLDVRADFPKVLELAARIAGLDQDDFGGPSKPEPRKREDVAPLAPMKDRIALARKRAAWVWARMVDRVKSPRRLLSDVYLERERGLAQRVRRDDDFGSEDDPNAALIVAMREDYRDTPLICDAETIGRGGPELEKLARMFSWPGIAVPVRSVLDGELVDIRVRRFEPRQDQPKIIGMIGGLTSAPAADGHGRELLGCYGHPHAIESDTVIVVEGLLDYLTALVVWPDCDVLGAVSAGDMGLVALHAAKAVARRSDTGGVLIVEQDDPLTKDGRAGAGKRSIIDNENSAAKTAIRVVGPRRVGWVFCGLDGAKDLNDLHRKGLPIVARWWADLGPAAQLSDLAG